MRDVLLVTVDSLRPDHLGCYGYDRNTTPFLDEFAEDAHRFTNAFANACMTRISFPTILASSYPSMYGGCKRMSESRTLLAEVLDEHNYATAGFHSNLYLSADFGYNRGFDKFYDSKTEPGLGARAKQAVKDRLNDDGHLYQFLGSLLDTAERQAGIRIGSAYVDADEITDKALGWVESVESLELPRFLWTHYMDVHHPYLPPENHQQAFRDDVIDERRAIQLRRKMMQSPGEVTGTELEDIIDLYDGEIRFTDNQVGRLVRNVRDQWGENTLVIVTSDHGEQFREHGGFSHTETFYDEVIKVPLLIDDGTGEGVYDDLTSLIDIPPTVLDYAEVSQPERFHSDSLRRVVDGQNWDRTHIIGEHVEDGELSKVMYRDTRWKYIENGNRELYDLNEDPGEIENLVEVSPAKAENMAKVVAEHREFVDANAGETEVVEMDEEIKQRLRDLGYKE